MRLGPVAERGAAPSVRMIVPSASTTSSPSTRSSILPYRVEYWPAPRHAIHPPTVEMSIDWGQWPNVYPVPDDPRAASRSGPNVPAPTSAKSDASSRWCRPDRPVRSRDRPPNTGIDPPHTPLPPAVGVTGTRASLHRRSTIATPAVSVGLATAAGCAGTWPRAAHAIESGHQSRAASARAPGSLDTATPSPTSDSMRASGTAIR